MIIDYIYNGIPTWSILFFSLFINLFFFRFIIMWRTCYRPKLFWIISVLIFFHGKLQTYHDTEGKPFQILYMVYFLTPILFIICEKTLHWNTISHGVFCVFLQMMNIVRNVPCRNRLCKEGAISSVWKEKVIILKWRFCWSFRNLMMGFLFPPH